MSTRLNTRGPLTRAHQQLCEQHLDLARTLARRWRRRLTHGVGADDLESEAYLGLMEAAQKFQPERGVRFETWAGQIISARLLDWLRVADHLTRTHRQHVQAGRLPDVKERSLDHLRVAAKLDATDRLPPPSRRLEHSSLCQLARACLDRRERLVVVLRYYEGWTFKAIGEALGVCQSYVSMMHADILARMRQRVEGYACEVE